MMGNHADGWWVLMWVWMAAFWILVLSAAAWLIWRLTQAGRGSNADEVLRQRLARGEIDPDQYRALLSELHPGDASSRGPRGGQLLLALVAALAVVTLMAAPAIAATRGDWDMFDHMGRMMGGGRNTAGATLTIGGSSETVTISDFTFTPGNLRVPVGATVTWMNRDSAPHNAAARDGSWSTPNLSQGESASVTFDRPGEYDYDCTIHPSMKAHLSVR
jgi:plastocyanin